jgi:hypothetical protein
MAGKQKYKVQEVIKAIQKSKKPEGNQHGIIIRTAIHLGCTRQTIHNYMNRYPEVHNKYRQIRWNYGITWGFGVQIKDPIRDAITERLKKNICD